MTNRRTLLGFFAALPLAAEAKPKRTKHKKNDKPKGKNGDEHNHMTFDHPETDAELTPEPDVTATPEPKATKKQRKKDRQEGSAQSLVSAQALVSAAPAPKLVTRYYGAADNGVDAYQPWQFVPGLKIKDAQRTLVPNGPPTTWELLNAGPFEGADCFCFGRTTGGHAGGTEAKWAEFDVRRDVRVGLVWRDSDGNRPGWLVNEWTAAGTVDAKNPEKGWGGMDPGNKLYVKDFPKGKVTIPGISTNGSVRILPWILFAEKDGAIPTQPATSQAQPKPNQTCPVWLHKSRKSRDGFPTWHPIADEDHHCYYGDDVLGGVHDHGSDWKWIYPAGDGGPNFGQIAKIAFDAGMMPGEETHFGHKCYVVEYPHESVVMGFVHHFGTWGIKRANTCLQQHHLLEIHARSLDRKTTYMQLRFMADYGRSIGTFSQDGGGDPINPSTCPNGNAATGYTTRNPSRQLAVMPFAGQSNQAYEPWGSGVDFYLNVLGFGGNTVFNTPDMLSAPSDMSGDVATELLYRSGTGRFFTPNNMSFVKPNHPASVMSSAGYFFTDPMAMRVYETASRPASAVRQHFNPAWDGFAAMTAGSPVAAHQGGIQMARWGDMCVPVSAGMPGDFEAAIALAHGPN